MASDGSDQNARYALSKLLQLGMVAEYEKNQEEHICYYWENCFSILNAEEAGNTKSTLFANTFGNSGVDESETSGPETPTKEVVDNGDMVDALSRVLEQTSLEKWVDSDSGKRDYTLFGALLFAFLNPDHLDDEMLGFKIRIAHTFVLTVSDFHHMAEMCYCHIDRMAVMGMCFDHVDVMSIGKCCHIVGVGCGTMVVHILEFVVHVVFPTSRKFDEKVN
nr:hypothetical protein [Tanacetum cinerariifolium]